MEPTDQFAIVGVGASAGGLKSIEALFDSLPNDTGMAFVIIQHLSREHKSLMTEILSRHTGMPVTLVSEEMRMEANHVYVIPPGKELRSVGDVLVISELPVGIHRPIDTFFESLANNEGVSSVGIVLSGTGSDGSKGIEAIRNAGGLTIAESLETAEFDGMPISAAKTGAVDLILRPDEIPAAIVKRRGLDMTELVDETTLSGVRLIFSLLEQQYNLRFEQYKPRTIARRIERRQTLGRFNSVYDYAEHLASDSRELDDLFHDLLIGVTKFFRDDLAFKAIEQHIDAQLDAIPDGETFRIWVMGCATGEEAYSLAIIALEAMERLGRKPLLKVFATDVHHRSLDFASRGEYPLDTMDFVSLERQTKYFEARDDHRFCVSRQLRKHLVFAHHNAIQDASFTNIHLVSCRNVLIYLRRPAQNAMLASAHFSLVEKGLLFLGASETLGELTDEFLTLDAKWRVFQKLRHRRDLVSHMARTSEKPTPISRSMNLINADQPAALTVRGLLDVYDAFLLSRVKLGLLLDSKQNLIHAIGDTTQILKGASGRFRGKITDFLDPPARTTITAALIRAQKKPDTNFVLENVQPISDASQLFNVSLMSLSKADANLGWIVQFEEVNRTPDKTIRVQHEPDAAYEQLETELQFTKESLSASVEELEASNEELQATNEEMVASNEELQSTNEELHSVNEELHSVNAELHRKIEQLEETTNDLETFLNSSDMGKIFLDEDKRIRKYTRGVTRYFNLMPYDVGRPLAHFTNRLGLQNLTELIEKVATSGNPYTSLGQDDFGESVRVNITPYQKGEVICGTVITVVNHSGFSPDPRMWPNAEGELGTWEWPDLDKDEMYWSPNCYQLLGLDPESPALFSRWKELIHPHDARRVFRVGTPQCPFIERGHLNVRMQHVDESYLDLEFRNLSAYESGDEKVKSMVGTVLLAGQAEAQRANELERMRHLENAVNDFQEFVYAVSHDLQAPTRQIRHAVDSLSMASQITESSSVKTMEAIRSRTTKLETMLVGLLDYSRVNTRGNPLVPCDADRILADVLEEFSEQIVAMGAAVIHEPLPKLQADTEQLRLLFWHLIDNAIKYRGENPLEIRISAVDEDKRTLISIADNGIGIPPGKLQDVFVIFRRLEEKPDVPGAGVGLSLCKRIVQRHGGWIWAESEIGKATTINFRMHTA